MSVDKNFNPSLKSPLYFIRKGLYKKIKEYAPQLRGRVLDFGCGAKPYKSLFVNATEYIGVDFSSEGHDHTNEDIDFYYDGNTLPFEDASFDAIFSSEVFEHIFNLPQIIKELHRVLKRGGTLFFTCPFVFPEHEVPVDYARYSQFALKDLLQKAGFDISIMDKSGDFTSAIFQLRVLYFRNHLMYAFPLLGKMKLFHKFCRQVAIPIINVWFSFLHYVLPKRKDLYLNNIILVQKSELW